MTNFNIRIVLDGKSELVTAWSLVKPTSHRIDKHTHARTHDMQDWHRWYDSVKILCASSFFKASYCTQCCPEKAETLMTRIRVRIRVCQQKKKTPKSVKKCLWLIVIPSDFKTISFENFTLWEIVARKPDFAAVSRTHDMHRLALLIRWVSKSRVL